MPNCQQRCNKCRKNKEQAIEGNVRIKGKLTAEGTTTNLSNVVVHGTITDESGGIPRLGPGGTQQGIAVITVIQTYNLSQLGPCVAINPVTFSAGALTINIDEIRFIRYRLINVGSTSLAIDVAGQSYLVPPCAYLSIQFGADPSNPAIGGPITL